MVSSAWVGPEKLPHLSRSALEGRGETNNDHWQNPLPVFSDVDLVCSLGSENLSYPSIPLLGIHPREVKAVSQRDVCTPIHDSQEVEVTQVFTDR